MISHVIRLLAIFLIPFSLSAQNLQLSVTPATSDNTPSTVVLEGEPVNISSGSIRFPGGPSLDFDAAGFSADLTLAGLLEVKEKKGRAALLSATGDTLNAFSTISLSESDPSLAIYPLNSGDLLIRDNIANFTFYDSFGEIETSLSNITQSEEGEAISEVAMSGNGSTVVIYNPKIRRNGELGSRAGVKTAENELENIFFSAGRFLKDITVSDDGTLIVALTAGDGNPDEVIVMDRFGNELNRIPSDEDLAGADLSKDEGYLTLYSGGRVQVFETLSGEQETSISVRSPVIKASYFPEDNMVIALSGDYSENTGVLKSVQVHAVHVKQRSIARRQLNTPIGLHDFVEPQLIRLSSGRYRLTGTGKHVDITASF